MFHSRLFVPFGTSERARETVAVFLLGTKFPLSMDFFPFLSSRCGSSRGLVGGEDPCLLRFRVLRGVFRSGRRGRLGSKERIFGFA